MREYIFFEFVENKYFVKKNRRDDIFVHDGFDDFVSFSILSLITYPNRMFPAAARQYNETKTFASGTSNKMRDLYDERRHYFIAHWYKIEEFWT